jgi:undecaprenyl-diphosphatase
MTDPTSSFPSGHSMAAISVYGTAAVALERIYPSIRFQLLVIAVIVAVMTGVARIARENHWASDVIAGFAFGGAVFGAAVFALNRL